MPSPPDPPAPPSRPTRPAPPRDLAQAEQVSRLLTLASIQFRRGQLPEAEKAVREILTQRPGDAGAHELLADIRLQRDDFAGAQESLQAALAAEPGRATAEAKLARAALRRTERERMATMGVAYAASDTALMRLSEGSTRRSGQWAALGSALVPGLGQYVNGETVKGVALAAVYFLVIVLLALLPDTHGLAQQIGMLFVPSGRAGRHAAPVSGLAWLLFVLLCADWLYAVVDAALASRRSTAAKPPPGQDGWQV